jgi:hypothetical protein
MTREHMERIGLEALSVGLPFDEAAVLRDNTQYLLNTLDVSTNFELRPRPDMCNDCGQPAVNTMIRYSLCNGRQSCEGNTIYCSQKSENMTHPMYKEPTWLTFHLEDELRYPYYPAIGNV